MTYTAQHISIRFSTHRWDRGVQSDFRGVAIRIYDATGNMIEMYEHVGELNEL